MLYLRNRKGGVCVYDVIMHEILKECSPQIPEMHHHTINAQDKFFYFFYNYK